MLRHENKIRILDLLKRREFQEACLAVASHEAAQDVPRGLNIDWKTRKPDRDVAILTAIFNGRPKILSKISDEQLSVLRLAAGMMHLLGSGRCKEWLPANFKTGLRMDNEVAARMLLFYASSQIELAQFREFARMGIRSRVEVVGGKDSSCPDCKAIANKKFDINQAIELPYEHCTHEMGCRCLFVAIR